MWSWRKSVVLCLCLVMTAGLLAGCGQQAAPPKPAAPAEKPAVRPNAERYGGTMVEGNNRDVRTLDPAFAMATSDWLVNESFYETLVRTKWTVDANGNAVASNEFVPCLALSWEKSADGRVWKFI